MRFHKRYDGTTCYWRHCEELGLWRVYGPQNEHYGTYCEKHADERVAELKLAHEGER